MSSVYKWCLPRDGSSQLKIPSSPHRNSKLLYPNAHKLLRLPSRLRKCRHHSSCAPCAFCGSAIGDRFAEPYQKLSSADLSRTRRGWSPAAARRGQDGRRTLPAMPALGLPCADPRSRTLSFTGREDMSNGILRHPDAATLGVSQLTHTALFSANHSDFHTRNVHNVYKQNTTQIIGNNRKK